MGTEAVGRTTGRSKGAEAMAEAPALDVKRREWGEGRGVIEGGRMGLGGTRRERGTLAVEECPSGNVTQADG